MNATYSIVVLCLIGFVFQSKAQDKFSGENYDSSTHRFRLDAGLTAGNSFAGPGQFIGVSAKLLGPLAIYTEVEHYQLENFSFHSTRFGAQVLLGRSTWTVQPEIRAGFDYGNSLFNPVLNGGLVFGNRYGGRINVHFEGLRETGDLLVLFQIGGYIRF